MIRNRLKNQTGFTLIEVMLAVAILAVGILGVASMQITAIRGNSFAGGFTEAATFAQDKVEELMALDYDDPDLDDDDGDGTDQDNNNDGIDDSANNFGLDDTANPDGSQVYRLVATDYNVFWNIANDEPENESKRIKVIVQWAENGRNRRMEINTIKVRM